MIDSALTFRLVAFRGEPASMLTVSASPKLVAIRACSESVLSVFVLKKAPARLD
jgi:hypothetical protein